VTCYTQPCKPCKVTYILHYLPQGDESSPRGRWGICAPALPEVLTSDIHLPINLLTFNCILGIGDEQKMQHNACAVPGHREDRRPMKVDVIHGSRQAFGL
jgi:hypothetical protein